MLQVRDQMAQLAAENGLKVSPGIAKALLPTPNTMDMLPARDPSKIDKSKGGYANVRETVINEVNSWGKFAPAIERWEAVLCRPAPAPTKPDGKDGAHRLSSEFTEWMMGLPAGWITAVGLSRNDELKACRNGVVPQQAEMALRILLDGVDLAV
jgi:DNA (cytosine-5)-methyltransferase 1